MVRNIPANRVGGVLVAYGATLLTFVALDAVWLATVAIDQFKQQIGSIMRNQPDWMAALAFYAIYPAGLLALAVYPARQLASRASATLKGAIVGLTAYATFDLTNLAIIKGWTWPLALADIAAGTIVSSSAATIGYLVVARMAGERFPGHSKGPA